MFVRPTKAREIEGVSGAAVAGLKAQLFQAQQDAREGKKSLSSKAKPVIKNRGVEERAKRDEEALEKELDPAEELARKSAQYAAMSRSGYIDDKEEYMVDFEKKGWDRRDRRVNDDEEGISAEAYLESEAQRESRRVEHRRVLEELEMQTQNERERAMALKQQRKAAAQKRVALRKKLAKKERKSGGSDSVREGAAAAGGKSD